MTKLAGRPKINILPTQNEYTIRCSTYQAKKYFAKFGKDAIILSPLSLRNEMIEFYKEAIEGYQNYSEEQSKCRINKQHSDSHKTFNKEPIKRVVASIDK